MRAPRFLPHLIAVVCLLAVAAPTVTLAALMGWYLPLHLGASWSYENPDNSLDFYVESIFEEIEYEGHPAYRFGRDLDNHAIIHGDHGVVTVYAIIDDGLITDLTEDLVLGEVVDGDRFGICSPAGCDSSLIRFWADLDPSLRSIYDMDPALTDMVILISYDPGHLPNLHNVVVESNLPAGVDPPTGAVVRLEWYLRSVGMVVIQDVDAATGGLVVRHELMEVMAADDGPGRHPLLHQNHPNPFNPSTVIAFELQVAGRVDLRVYDLGGRLVRTLLTDEALPAGRSEKVWRGRDDTGAPVATGVYLYELVTGDRRETRRMVLMK